MRVYITIFLIFISVIVFAKKKINTDSLYKVFCSVKADTTRLKLFKTLLVNLNEKNKDELEKYTRDFLRMKADIKEESLKNELIYLEGGISFYKKENEKAITLLTQALEGYKSKNNIASMGETEHLLGNTYYMNCNDFVNAIPHYKNAIKFFLASNNPAGAAESGLSLGFLYVKKADYKNALEVLLSTVKIYEKEGNKLAVIKSLTNIGSVFAMQKDNHEALRYFQKAAEVAEKENYRIPLAFLLNNIGVIYKDLKKYDLAILNFEKSFEIKKSLNEKAKLGSTLDNLGDTYIEIEDYSKAENYLIQALKLHTEINDVYSMAYSCSKIGKLRFMQGKNQESMQYYKKALDFAAKVHAKDLIKDSYLGMANCYKKTGNYARALDCFEAGSAVKDSIFSEENQQQINEMKTKYETEKKEQEIEILNKDKEIKQIEIKHQNAELRKQQIIIFITLGGFIVVSILVFIAFFQYRQKKRAFITLELQNNEIKQKNEEITSQRDEIEAQRDKLNEQNEKLEEQKQEITDSITYAKRIQQALLPDLNSIMEDTRKTVDMRKQFASSFVSNDDSQDFFILFKPKDIVSGDFYWSTKINEWLIITVADCTGHGVPGAFMSMLGMSFLNEIVRKKEITKASMVLDQLRESVIDALKQKGESGEQKDGMDISLCAINTTTLEMQYAGANNPCWIIVSHPSSDVSPLIELKPDKQPIGIHTNMQPFTNQNYQLQKGSIIYLMSDGYEDQFGGLNRKKFLAKNLKNLILTNCHMPMAEQQNILETKIVEWIGSEEQIDDITVLGMKI